jgi:FixJ family two-component response regulator
MISPPLENSPLVFVVDDDIAVREALDSLIRSVGLRVECFPSAAEFLRRPAPESPACLVLDVRLPGLGGLELQKRMLGVGRVVPIIFITGHGDIPMSVRAMKAGAVEFLTKPFREQDLLAAIRQAIALDRAALLRQAELAELSTRYDLVTPREREVMRLVVGGMLNKQIAARLGTTEITVKIQRGSMMKKMKTASVAELVRLAERLGISAAS